MVSTWLRHEKPLAIKSPFRVEARAGVGSVSFDTIDSKRIPAQISGLIHPSKADAKVRTAITGYYAHLTAMALNDLLDQVQSQTGAAAPR